jgi:nucleotidyltransferase/DNA polymerase involved in DNA repair
VIVGADPQEGRGRGVVSAASYEAQAFGIHSAMPISQAYRRCPQGLFLPVRMARYQEVSAHIFAIFHRYTDLVEPLGLDEAFLDVTGSFRLFGSAEAIGRRIQAEGVQARTLTLKFRDEIFRTLTRAASLPEPTDQAPILYRMALALLDRIPQHGQKVRLLGLAASKLHAPTSAGQQLSLFSPTSTRQTKLTAALEAIRARFGDEAIHPASLLPSSRAPSPSLRSLRRRGREQPP